MSFIDKLSLHARGLVESVGVGVDPIYAGRMG